MDDYISRKAVETFLRSRNYCLDTEADIEYVIERFREEIPAADVRPVVRCGECIRKDICRSSNIWAVSPDDNWFCADGERREGGTP